MTKVIIILMLLSVTLSGQYPILDEFNSFDGVGEWATPTGYSNCGSHNSEMCWNTVGQYSNNSYYEFISPTYDFSSDCDSIRIEWSVSQNLRSGDILYLYYWDSGWYYYDITGYSGIYNSIIPSTATYFTFDLSTYGTGSRLGKYAHIDYFKIGCYINGTLPIELVDFNCDYNDNTVVISWITASENNVDYFIIDESEDGENWNFLTSVFASNTSDIREYSVIDGILSQNNYYRLIEVDYDGSTKYFYPINCTTNSRYFI